MYRSPIKESNEKKEKQDSKKELGKFCSYYGYHTIIAHSKRKNKQNDIKSKKPSTKSKFQKKYCKFNPNKSKSSNKSTLKRKTSTLKRKTSTCYKCGKVGHYSKDCQLENKINSLEISDKLKNLMIGLMIDKENEDSSEEYELEEDNQILIIQEILSEELSQDEEESDDKKDCDGICACSYKSINLISKNSKTPLNILIHNYLPLINSIYFQFWHIKDKLIRSFIYVSKEVLNSEFSIHME